MDVAPHQRQFEAAVCRQTFPETVRAEKTKEERSMTDMKKREDGTETDTDTGLSGAAVSPISWPKNGTLLPPAHLKKMMQSVMSTTQPFHTLRAHGVPGTLRDRDRRAGFLRGKLWSHWRRRAPWNASSAAADVPLTYQCALQA